MHQTQENNKQTKDRLHQNKHSFRYLPLISNPLAMLFGSGSLKFFGSALFRDSI
jgi:hypothetical protein